MPPLNDYGLVKTPEQLEEERQARAVLAHFRSQAVFDPESRGAFPVQELRGNQRSVSYLYPQPGTNAYVRGPGRPSLEAQQAAAQNYALAQRGVNETESNKAAAAQALAALRQAAVEEQRLQYEAQASGITLGGANAPKTLFAPTTQEDGTVTNSLPPEIQADIFDKERVRAETPGIPISRVLADLTQKYDADQPGVANLIQTIRANRPEDLRALVEGRSVGFGDAFDNFMSRLVRKPINYFYPQTAPQTPEGDVRGLLYQSEGYRDERLKALQALRRFAPDLFNRRFDGGLF